MLLKKLTLAGAVVALWTSGAWAACENTVAIKSLTNAFPAYVAMTDVMTGCGNFEAELDIDHRLKLQPALSANPSLYQLVGLTNATSVPLLDEGLIIPLDDLVAKYGQNLNENQFIRINGKIMAIAALVNNAHLMYREDVLSNLGIAEPTNYAELLAAAEKIKTAGVVDYPLGGIYKANWNLGEEFVNMYLGNGGQFLDANNNATINNPAGIKTLETMKAMTAYMDPEYLVSDTTFVTKQFQQGKIAMALLWASRAGAVNDPTESQFAGKIKMAAAPMGDKRPGATLWWDGWAVAKNASEEQTEAAFKLIIESMHPDVIKANNDTAVWLAKGFTPGPAAVGAIATAQGGAVPYPASKAMGALHNELAAGLADYLTGRKDAASALASIEASYTTSAKESGIIQ